MCDVHPCAGAVSPPQRGPANPPSTPSTSSNSTHDILGMYSVYLGCLYLPEWIMEWNNGMEYGTECDESTQLHVTVAAQSKYLLYF